MNNHEFPRGFCGLASLMVVLVLGFSSCAGGGSAGTGTTTRTIEGVVNTPENQPVPGATVTIIETGDSTLTAADGSFALATESFRSDLVLEVSLGQTSTEVPLNNLDEQGSAVNVQLTFDPDTGAAGVVEVEVNAQVVGQCDVFFENFRIIRQANKTPPGIECTVKVSVKKKGVSQGNIPVALQVRACPETSAWNTLSQVLTSEAFHPGIAQIPFAFYDSSDTCVYRIIAPFNLPPIRPVFYEIHTFTKQAYDQALLGQIPHSTSRPQ